MRLTSLVMMVLAYFLASAGLCRGFQTNPVVHAEFEKSQVVAGEAVSLKIRVSIPQGYHIYGGKNNSGPTKLTITATSGLQPQGEYIIPDGVKHIVNGADSYWLEGDVQLSQEFIVPTTFSGEAKIEGKIEYLMCNRRGCLPPGSVVFSATVTVDKTRGQAQKNDRRTVESGIHTSGSELESPQILNASGKFFNEDGKRHCPAPAMFDLDNDGVDELIIGDLDGNFIVLRSENTTGKGDPIWGNPSNLKNKDQRMVKVPNW